MEFKKGKDHWAFLEEVEAPMWVDLTLEAKYTNQDVDNEWFHTTHLFHQCSAHQLKSAFAHFGEGSDLDLWGPSSPKVPSSVSRSRGKHYKSKKWTEENCDFLLNKQRPDKGLSEKHFRVDSGYGNEIKPKLSFIKSKGTSISETNLVLQRTLKGNAKGNNTKPIYARGVSGARSSSMLDKAESSSSSTLTFESSQQEQPKNLEEVSNQAFGHTSGLLSAVRIGIRKSCVTRQAVRVEMNNDRRQSRDRKSSLSKSSVGSSSNPGYDVRSSRPTLIQKNKETTPDSRNGTRMTDAANNRAKVSNVFKGSSVQVKEETSISKRWGASNVTKPAQEAPKSKVQNKTTRPKALLPARVNEQGSFAGARKDGEKVRNGRHRKLVSDGKENATMRMSVLQKSSGRSIAPAGMVRVPIGRKQNMPQKGDSTGLIDPKGRNQSLMKGRNSMNVIEKGHH